MSRIPIAYRATGRFSPIVLDHLDDHVDLREFRSFSPDREGLHAALAARRFPEATRRTLCAALEDQYAGMSVQPAVRRHLDLLRRPDTLTVTTGHQLCLFTGPLYVPFKILNTIRLAAELSTPERPVVPVFWMATEDHDRAEIDHAFIRGHRVDWPGAAGGAVGRMKLEGITATLDAVDALLGPGSHADELRSLLRSCYRPEHSLATATRLFVDALFGRFGLVVLDADEPALKAAFAPVMREELVNEVAVRSVQYANEKLAAHYKVQAHARAINLFHLRPGHRSRIVAEGEHYRVLDGGPVFTLNELLRLLEEQPGALSPNVLLRPVYQECILPNIAYVGGGGELAYWFQLKWLFHAVQQPLPVLLLRTSAAFLSPKDLARTEALGLTPEELFLPQETLRARVARAEADFSTDLSAEREEAAAYYAALATRAQQADPTLKGAVEAVAARAMHGLDALERKLLRAAKRQQAEPLARLAQVEEGLFPGGGLQERRENFMPWYAAEGPAFFDRLLAELDPLDPRFSLLVQ